MTASAPETELTLFKKREHIHPHKVSGKYRRLKWLTMGICLTIYYFAPFLRWDRGPGAPDQAILIDLESRRAYWFFIEIWPQEVYYLTGILIFAAIAMFFVTSLLGRVWCGYFCFQTVWTDLYMMVERLVQGDGPARKKLDASPWGLSKIWKKGLTHFIWLLIGLCTGGAFVFYFNDAPTLWHQVMQGDVSPTVMSFVGGLTLTTYVMAGLAREQVCTYMCPYARFQSAMFDEDTLIIGYDEKRGEPRGHHKKNESWEGRGHCIDCTRCVQVCPTGIDIRKGLQMECIACGLCVDACNDIMDKVGLPQGLIRYDTSRNMKLHSLGQTPHLRIIRPRTFYYIAVLCLVGGVMLYGLLNRAPTELHVLHDRNPLYVRLSDDTIRNGYTLKILNKTRADSYYVLTLEGLDNAVIEVRGAGELSADSLFVPANSVGDFRIFVKAPLDLERTEIVFKVTDKQTGYSDDHESMFVTKGAQ